jgi:hypothetical protein
MSTTFAESLLDSMATQTVANADYLAYLTALAQCFEGVFALAMDQGYPDDPDYIPGWSVLLDVDACPTQYLPYLAMFNGTQIPVGANDATARQIIRAEAGMQRGTGLGGAYTTATIPAGGAIISAAQRNLSGTQSVILLERTAADGTPDAYHFVLIVKPGEVVSVSALTADVTNAKPGGIQWTLVQTVGYTWSTAIHVWSADTFTWDLSATTQP